jgi:hypothetical protein
MADRLKAHNDYNRRVFDALHHQMEAGEGVALSLTNRYRPTLYGQPVVAIKSFIMSPFTDERAMKKLVECIESARTAVAES